MTILYEDNHLIVLNKQAGDLVQGDKTGDVSLRDQVKRYLKETYHKPGEVYLGVVHRLDRPTSGVVLFAKTSKALSRLNRAFAEGKVKKTYWAVVQPVPELPAATLTHWLVRNPGQNKSYAHPKEVPQSKKAVLAYTLLKTLHHYALLGIDLYTGRHHQIRAQLAAVGCCIKGDLKYGAGRSNANGGIHLHARSLVLEHPVQRTTLRFEAPPPEDPLWNACL